MMKTKADIVLDGRYKGLTVPAGTRVTECRRVGSDTTTHYWVDEFAWIEAQTGFKDSMYKHDAVHYGITLEADQVEGTPDPAPPPTVCRHCNGKGYTRA